MNYTKIMCTLTPERESAELITSLSAAGMQAVRINSAFATPQSISQSVKTLRSFAPDIKILMDTKGPEVRTTAVESPIVFSTGDETEFLTGHGISSHQTIYLNLPYFPDTLAPGAHMLIDDGEIEFEAVATSPTSIKAVCTKDGTLGSQKTFVVPKLEMPYLPAISRRDAINIKAAKECGIDMIAHSFVRGKADIAALRELIKGTDIKLYAKIECKQGVENFEEILEAADGILVARGDLGAEMGLTSLPALQHRFALATRHAHKPLILATGLFGSMTESMQPSRAEVNDVALAIMQGFDWLLLTGETARGKHPVDCVRLLNETIVTIENANLRCSIK